MFKGIVFSDNFPCSQSPSEPEGESLSPLTNLQSSAHCFTKEPGGRGRETDLSTSFHQNWGENYPRLLPISPVAMLPFIESMTEKPGHVQV